MSCAQNWSYHSAEPRNRQQEGNWIQTAACQILICLPVVVQAADNIDTLCDISGNTWQDAWEGTCLQDYSKWAVLSHSSVSSVLITCTVTPHVSVHLLTVSLYWLFSAVRRKPDRAITLFINICRPRCIFVTSGTSFIMACCYWNITFVQLQKDWQGNCCVVSLKFADGLCVTTE